MVGHLLCHEVRIENSASWEAPAMHSFVFWAFALTTPLFIGVVIQEIAVFFGSKRV